MKLTDTHCHLDFRAYRDDLAEVVSRAFQSGLERILVPGIDVQSSEQSIQLAERFAGIFSAVGVHPNSTATWDEETVSRLMEMSHHEKVVAIGEIGLDYYRDHSTPAQQRKALLRQLDVAAKRELPVILHVRNRSEQDRTCMNDLLTILRDWVSQHASEKTALGNRWGVLHSFSGNVQESYLASELGFYIGITGPITYKNAEEMRQVVRNLPADRLLVETDGPFLTPLPFRGRRNEPAYVRYIIEKISDLLEIPAVEIAALTSKNAGCLFRWREAL